MRRDGIVRHQLLRDSPGELGPQATRHVSGGKLVDFTFRILLQLTTFQFNVGALVGNSRAWRR